MDHCKYRIPDRETRKLWTNLDTWTPECILCALASCCALPLAVLRLARLDHSVTPRTRSWSISTYVTPRTRSWYIYIYCIYIYNSKDRVLDYICLVFFLKKRPCSGHCLFGRLVTGSCMSWSWLWYLFSRTKSWYTSVTNGNISIYIYIYMYVFIFKYLYIYTYIHTYYITLHCISFRYNTIQWQYIYSTFTVQYTTLHNVTLHTYIPAKVHQIARTEVMVRNFQGQNSGLIFIKVELSYTYLYNSKDKVLVYIYIHI